MRYIVDTHTLLWHIGNDRRLGPNARRILADPNTQLIVPVPVLAEAKHAADRKRVSVPFESIPQVVTNSSRIHVLSLDISIVGYLSSRLDIHDSIIKDFFGEDISILTNDLAITQSNLIPVVW
jgi:PIN domain nuclease of toxin-antitoxin system